MCVQQPGGLQQFVLALLFGPRRSGPASDWRAAEVVVLAQTLSSLRMEDAKASKPEDKIMIDSCVQARPRGQGRAEAPVCHVLDGHRHCPLVDVL